MLQFVLASLNRQESTPSVVVQVFPIACRLILFYERRRDISCPGETAVLCERCIIESRTADANGCICFAEDDRCQSVAASKGSLQTRYARRDVEACNSRTFPESVATNFCNSGRDYRYSDARTAVKCGASDTGKPLREGSQGNTSTPIKYPIFDAGRIIRECRQRDPGAVAESIVTDVS